MRARIIISRRFTATVALLLGGLASFLAFLSVFGHVFDYVVGAYLPGSPLGGVLETAFEPFHLGEERSFPTLYTATMLLTCSLLSAGIAISRRAAGAAYARYWAGLAAIFLYLYADETLRLHESAVEPLRDALGTDGFFYYAWVVPGLILVIFLAMLYARFVLDLSARSRTLVLAAATLYVGGVLGLEMVGGYLASSYGRESAWHTAEANVEESLEMLGITVFIYALLEYVRLYVKEVVVPPANG